MCTAGICGNYSAMVPTYAFGGIIKLKFKLLDFHPAFDTASLRHACFRILNGSSPFVLVFTFAYDISEFSSTSGPAFLICVHSRSLLEFIQFVLELLLFPLFRLLQSPLKLLVQLLCTPPFLVTESILFHLIAHEQHHVIPRALMWIRLQHAR